MVKKVIVHEGLTSKDPAKDVYTKSYIGLEWDLPDEVDEATVARTMIHMRTLIRQELGAPDVSQVPEFDSAEVDKLPWKAKGGTFSEDGHWGWILGPASTKGVEPGAETLANALEHTADHAFVIGNMEYSFSKDKAFINRKPVKQKSAR